MNESGYGTCPCTCQTSRTCCIVFFLKYNCEVKGHMTQKT